MRGNTARALPINVRLLIPVMVAIANVECSVTLPPPAQKQTLPAGPPSAKDTNQQARGRICRRGDGAVYYGVNKAVATRISGPLFL